LVQIFGVSIIGVFVFIVGYLWFWTRNSILRISIIINGNTRVYLYEMDNNKEK